VVKLEEVKNKKEEELKEPSMYNVVFLNDDYTPFDFVVKMLTFIFSKSNAEANALAYKIHQKGKSIVGTYSFDIAATKATQTMSEAKENGYPLAVQLEEN
jgi:ATP-dependent Clp protease adaptor protein ClpS